MDRRKPDPHRIETKSQPKLQTSTQPILYMSHANNFTPQSFAARNLAFDSSSLKKFRNAGSSGMLSVNNLIKTNYQRPQTRDIRTGVGATRLNFYQSDSNKLSEINLKNQRKP